MPRQYSGKIVSKAAKMSLSMNFNPGPGNYDPYKKDSQRNGKFGTESRERGYNNNVVGPGAYERNSDFDNKTARRGFSMGKAGRDALANNRAPGPGSYDFNGTSLRDGPQWKMGVQKRYNF